MIIISDTTPLITLIKINELNILKDMFGEIVIPEEVYKELTSDVDYIDEKLIIDNAEFIKVKNVDSSKINQIIAETGLDRGESAAIALYEDQTSSALLIIDEKKGREVASKRNIRITGTIGILLLSYRKKIRTRDEIFKIIDLIKEKRNYYSEELFDLVIKEINGV